MTAKKYEEIRVGGVRVQYLVEGVDSGGSLAMFEFMVGPGAKVPAAHSHDAYEETLYGLEGTILMTVDGQKHEVGPGDVLCIPRGVVHRFDNPYQVESKTLAVVTPGILSSSYFREVGAVLAAAAGGPPNLAAIAEVMKRHGLTAAA